jgi:hypothetical protein
MTRIELPPAEVPLRRASARARDRRVIILSAPSHRVMIRWAALLALAFVLVILLTPQLAWLALEIGTRVADLFFDRRTDQHEWTSLLISMLTVPATQVSFIACFAWLGWPDRKRNRQRAHQSEIISMAMAARRRATAH